MEDGFRVRHRGGPGDVLIDPLAGNAHDTGQIGLRSPLNQMRSNRRDQRIPQGRVGAGAATYYVDATSGDDFNSGISTNQAWQTISKVNNYANSPGFLSGDQILFKRGEVWSSQQCCCARAAQTPLAASGLPAERRYCKSRNWMSRRPDQRPIRGHSASGCSG